MKEEKKKAKKDKKKLAKEQFTQGWSDYRNAVIENKNKSQDDFEKYINLLASGVIVLSLTFLEKIVTVDKTTCKGLFIGGLALVVFTLVSNLYSHYKSIKNDNEVLKEIDAEEYDMVFENTMPRNKIINLLNRISIGSLIIGTVCILSFVSINLFALDKKAPVKIEKTKSIKLITTTKK